MNNIQDVCKLKAIIVFIITFHVFSMYPATAYANSCMIVPVERYLNSDSSYIFRGEAVWSMFSIAALWDSWLGDGHASAKVTFRVSKVYKGDIGEYFTVSSSRKRFKAGQEYIVFVGKDKNSGACSRVIPFSSKWAGYVVQNKGQTDILELEKYLSAKLIPDEDKRLEHTLQGYEYYMQELKAGTREYTAFMLEKAKLFEEENKLQEAREVYDALFKSGQNYDEIRNMLSAVLYNLGDYQEVLKIATEESGVPWRILALLQLGYKEMPDIPYRFIGYKIKELNLKDVKLRNANFSNAVIDHLVIEKADLTGGIFRGAQIGHASIKNSELDNTNFRDAKLTAEFYESDFSAASFKCSHTQLDRVQNSFFVNTDFSLANLSLPNGYEGEGLVAGENWRTEECSSHNKFREYQKQQEKYASVKSANIYRLRNFSKCKLDQKAIWAIGKNAPDVNAPPQKDFSFCKLSGVKFKQTDLTDANFSGAVLDKTDFTEAKLEDANFGWALLGQNVKFPADFKYNDHKFIPFGGGFSADEIGNCTWLNRKGPASAELLADGNDIYKLIARDLDLSEHIFFGAWLPAADFSGANLVSTAIGASYLVGANFKDAKLNNAVLWNSVMDRADFTNADLTSADFRSARLLETRFDNANLDKAIYDESTLFPEGFDPDEHGMLKVNPYSRRKYTEHIDPEVLFLNKIHGLPFSAEIYGVATDRSYTNKQRADNRVPKQAIVEVIIEKTGVPIILVVSTNEPTIWRIKNEHETKIAAVIISGADNQDVEGLARGVKVYNYGLLRNYRRDDKSWQRPNFTNTVKCGYGYDRMEYIIHGVTGKKITSFQSEPNANAFVIK